MSELVYVFVGFCKKVSKDYLKEIQCNGLYDFSFTTVVLILTILYLY